MKFTSVPCISSSFTDSKVLFCFQANRSCYQLQLLHCDQGCSKKYGATQSHFIYRLYVAMAQVPVDIAPFKWFVLDVVLRGISEDVMLSFWHNKKLSTTPSTRADAYSLPCVSLHALTSGIPPPTTTQATGIYTPCLLSLLYCVLSLASTVVALARFFRLLARPTPTCICSVSSIRPVNASKSLLMFAMSSVRTVTDNHRSRRTRICFLWLRLSVIVVLAPWQTTVSSLCPVTVSLLLRIMPYISIGTSTANLLPFKKPAARTREI